MDSSEKSRSGRRNWTLWLILAICVLPVVASTLLYFLWTPTRFVNHGELLEPVPLADVSLSRSDGGRFAFSELGGQWAFVSVDDAACDEHCLKKLYLMRQIRLTQGKNSDRIERVWLVSDGNQPAPQTLQEYRDMRTVLLSPSESLSQFPAENSREEYIYLVDPIGNLMMRFPREVDPSRMKKDVAKLLRISSGWRRLDR
ncbi:MAG: hypothetical protein JSU95_00670 [Betaproteobacteria bacterium]|nr:MAG: hypothetical protein JSU95_00670 [Betaproteobacteria bacterium]